MSRKTWNKPKLNQFGNIETITQQKQTKLKKRGIGDDFGEGISNA